MGYLFIQSCYEWVFLERVVEVLLRKLLSKRLKKAPYLNSWKRVKKRKIPLLLLLFKNRKKGNVYGCLSFYGSWSGYGVFHNSKHVFNKVKCVFEIMWILSFLLVPKRESLCRKREVGGCYGREWNHSLIHTFKSF